jgi:hypothetical protein
MAVEQGIGRTASDYLRFLRESWPVVSVKDRPSQPHGATRPLNPTASDPTPSITCRVRRSAWDSAADARIYDLLPFADAVDPRWGEALRRQNPALAGVTIPAVTAAPLRSGVLVTPGRDRPELVEAAFERHPLLFLPRQAAENPKRAAAIAESAKDATRRHAGMALVLPYLARADPRQAEQWLWTLSALDQRVETSADLEFYVAWCAPGSPLAKSRTPAG